MTNKTQEFAQELGYIKNPQIKLFAESAIELLPNYFFIIPSSSTGKYHPAYALGEGGLLRHTRSAIRIVIELFRLEQWHFTEIEKDLIIVALILHDGWKNGTIKQNFTITEHPKVATQVLLDNKENLPLLSEEQFDFICSCISRHMGQWVFDYRTKEKVLNKPETECEKFVHLVDYLASRKCLIMDFNIDLSNR